MDEASELRLPLNAGGLLVHSAWQWGVAMALALSLRPSALAQESVCARVKIEILQELTLEREAFEARMTIHNGVAGISIDNISVDVNFADRDRQPVNATKNPNDLSAKFFYRLQDGYDIPGTIAGGTSGTIKWLIIPAPGAAGGTALGETYYVGATLRYRAAGQDNEVAVDPDDILVKPMPALTLDYFLPNEVYGDDPFTQDFVEPPIPFTLGVRVKNSGIGTARKLKIDSAQPRIVENKLGLLVDFKLHGCEVNGGVAQPTLLADFGDIAPSRSGVARWIMTSSLSGRFVEFSAYYTHADELGGQLTSLITAQPKTHFLLHDVLVDLPGRDAVRDFLARDGAELRVYESENADTPVSDQSAASSLFADAGRYQVRTAPMAGFLFIRLTDPLAGRQVLQAARRADGKTLPGPNAWLSQTWDRTALIWNYYVNVFDVNNTAGAGYLLQYKDAPQQTNRPPRIDPLSNWTIGLADRLSFPITATDPDGDRLAFRLESPAPTEASVTPEGTFSWEPGLGAAPSTNRITVSVTDNGMPALSDRRAFTLVVRDPSASEPPMLALSTNLLAYLELSGFVRLDPLAQVTDADTPVLSGGRLTVAVIEGRTAADALTLADPGRAQTNITVTAENVVEYRSVPVGTLSLENTETNFLAVDFNANATLEAVQEVVRTVAFRNTAVRGVSPDRVIQWTLSDGEGGLSAPVDLALEVWPVNHAPVAVSDSATTMADTPIALLIAKLVGNDSDPDGDALSFELLGSITAQRGIVEVQGGVVFYFPDALLVGADTFNYRVTDPYGGWAEATVVVDVRAPTATTPNMVWIKADANGTVRIDMMGIPNRAYTVQWSEDLLYWEFLRKVTAQPSGEVSFTEQTTDTTWRFYRIVYP